MLHELWESMFVAELLLGSLQILKGREWNSLNVSRFEAHITNASRALAERSAAAGV